MEDVLKIFGDLVGNQILAGVILILVAYYGVIGFLKLISALREHKLNLSSLDALRKKYEILKISYEIEVLKKEHSLPITELENRITQDEKMLFSTLNTRQSHLQRSISANETITEYINKHSRAGYLLLYFSHFILRVFPVAFLTLISMFEWFGGPSVRWERAFPLSLLLVLGFLLSNYILYICKRAQLSDKFGFWSYVYGAVLGGGIYLFELYPSSF